MSGSPAEVTELLLLSPRPDTDPAFHELARRMGPVVDPVPVRVVGPAAAGDAVPRPGAALVADGGRRTLELLAGSAGWSWFHLTASGPDHMADWGPLPGDPLVTYSRGVNARAVAEWVLAAILHFHRDFDLYTRTAGEGGWERRWARELGGRRLVVLGAGHAGSELARVAAALGMHPEGVTRSGTPVEGFEAVHPAGSEAAESAWRRAEVAVVLLPLTPGTRGAVDEARIRALPRGTLLAVASRGGIVDEEAVLRAVQDGHLAGAAFDVFATEPLPPDSPLRSEPRILVTPHVAGTTDRFMERTAGILAQIWGAWQGEGDVAELEQFRYRPA